MPSPVLVVLAGPNGAGKTTLFERVLAPVMHLEFVNADRIAAERWPDAQAENGYEAARIAADRRQQLLSQGRSFITETVFSHPSKLELMTTAKDRGYRVHLHVVLIPEELSVARVASRVEHGGHDVPEDKIRGRYTRLWGHLRAAVAAADDAWVYDNSRAASPLRVVAQFVSGQLVTAPTWPTWVSSRLDLPDAPGSPTPG